MVKPYYHTEILTAEWVKPRSADLALPGSNPARSGILSIHNWA